MGKERLVIEPKRKGDDGYRTFSTATVRSWWIGWNRFPPRAATAATS